MATMSLTLLHGSKLQATQHIEGFAEKELNVVSSNAAERHQIPILLENEHHSRHQIAGLDCSTHGGPHSTKVTHELVYWKDIPLDTEYISPLKSSSERQYLTFEPDGGKFKGIPAATNCN